jgi:predicted acetyltransferase
MRTVFKSSSDSETIKKEIEICERDSENLAILIDTVNIHLGKDVIPKLKRAKLKIYKSMLSSFSVAEISNAHSIATFWNKIADNKYIMQEIMNNNGSSKK